MGGEDMKDNKLEVGTLCTITKSDPSIWYMSDKSGYWVVTKFRDDWHVGHRYQAFSLTHQHDCWFHHTHLVPVVKSGV